MPQINSEISDIIRAHWDGRAKNFDRESGHGLHSSEQRQAWLSLLSELTSGPTQRVLDLGCGTGFLALLFAELGHTVTGIDLSPQMIERAREKATESSRDIEFRVHDAASVGDSDATYDLAIARHVIWNLPDPARAAREWMRVLKPGGQLALIEGKWADNRAMAECYARPTRRMLDSVVDRALVMIARLVGRGGRRLSARKYRRLDAFLPFSGGPEAERLVAFLSDLGFVQVTSRALMESKYWGEPPGFPRFLVCATKPATTN